jgi:hypothetical protein
VAQHAEDCREQVAVLCDMLRDQIDAAQARMLVSIEQSELVKYISSPSSSSFIDLMLPLFGVIFLFYFFSKFGRACIIYILRCYSYIYTNHI